MIRIIFFLLLPFLVYSQNKLDYKVSIVNGQEIDLQTLKDQNTGTGWFPGWNQGDYPVRALITFNTPVFLTKIRLYDWVGKPKFSVYGNNKKIIERDLSLYGQWQEWEVNTTTKLSEVIIQISDIQGDRPITELEFYGSQENNPNPPSPPLKKISGDALKIGVNGFHWIPTELNPTPNLRMYQMSQWTWTKDGIAVEPTFQANGMYDSYLTDAKKNGTNVIFCINKIPDWFTSHQSDEWADQPFRQVNSNGTDPKSYQEFGEYAFQLVARYGSKLYPSSVLKVNKNPRWNGDQVNTEKSGLNLIKYIELENEPDRPWKSPLYKYTPEELAALMSALWDGDEGRLGKYVGVKNADPNVKLVLPGLSSINLSYLNRMNIWFKTHRKDQQFCADVINVHHYSNISNPFPGPDINLVNGNGVSPEDDKLPYRLKEFKLFCSQNFPKCEVWYSEFGYDTQKPSTILSQYPKLYGNHTAEELQGEWLTRIYLYSLSCGMDKSFMFNLCDEDSADQGYLFGSSGILTSERTGYKKKESWKKIDWLVRELNFFRFYKDQSLVNGPVILEFRNNFVSKFFYWNPTSNDSTSQFQIGSKKLTATEKVQTYTISRLFNHAKIK